MGEWLTIDPGGSRAYLAMPERGSGPGILMLHAWWGLTPTIMKMCDRLASEGYVVLAPSLYPGGETTASIDEAEKLLEKHQADLDAASEILLASADRLRGLPAVTGDRIGTIGFSLGAFWALRLSEDRPDEVGAVVVFYGTGGGDFTQAQAAYLGHFAEDDDYEPLDGVQDLEASIREAGHDVTFHIYPGTGHWFCEPDRQDAYDHDQAELAWTRTLEFLGARLAPADAASA